ncbi:MAG: sulfatase-like hydrolase/transferase [Actinomycetota bacterium]
MQSPRKETRNTSLSHRLEATRFERFSALVVLTAFGLTWPVLDLLGQNAEFFLARQSPKSEIAALALAATLGIPAAVGLIGSVPGWFGSWFAAAGVAVTAASLARLYLSRLPLPVTIDLAVALGLGIATTWAFFRYPVVRQIARYLLPAPLLLLAIFLLAMPAGAVIRESGSAVGNPVPVDDPLPVMMVVFDEFPVASIIDPEGDLREDLFPNFARLASDGVWYRNAMTVEQQTEHSVPAMLTGSVPDQSSTPIAGQHPFNLFTALRTSHDLHVREAITQLCPRQLCEGLAGSTTSLVRDVGVVAGHVLLPEPTTRNLPPIDEAWGGFGTVAEDFDVIDEFNELMEEGSRRPIDEMLARIDEGVGARPPLYYLHTLIPHHPWQYLPDGRSYPYVVGANPASEAGGWIDDEFLVAQGMQRHLLQVGYADFVLGELIAALEQEGVYDDALVIVVADHGISIKAGVDHQRTITDTTVGEIAAIPLFVKYPASHRAGEIDDRRALTIDILPTIADVLDADLPGDVEGSSLLDPPPDRQETTTHGPEGSVTYGTDGDEKLQVASHIEEWFPGGDPWVLRPRSSPDLVGRRVDVGSLTPSDITGRVREPELYEDVDTGGPVIPVRVGAVLGEQAEGDELIAVVVNGEIAAMTRSYVFEEEVSALAMVRPEQFVDGANRVDFLEVTADGELRLIASSG